MKTTTASPVPVSSLFASNPETVVFIYGHTQNAYLRLMRDGISEVEQKLLGIAAPHGERKPAGVE